MKLSVQEFGSEYFETLNQSWDLYCEPIHYNQTAHRKAVIFIPKQVGKPLREVTDIGMWVSGGIDSAMTTYLLCKMIKDNNLPVTFHPFSSRRGRPWNPMYAMDVTDFIRGELDLSYQQMAEHVVYYPDESLGSDYIEIDIFTEKDTLHFKENIVQIMYSGVTANPPIDDKTISRNKERTRDDEEIKKLFWESETRSFINCFSNTNKKIMKTLYDKFNLIDNLFPITRSCEGSDYETGNYTYPCEKCWWCEERNWAFGRYG